MKTAVRYMSVGPLHNLYTRTVYTFNMGDDANTVIEYVECGRGGGTLSRVQNESPSDSSTTNIGEFIHENEFSRYKAGHQMWVTKKRLLFKKWTNGLDLDTEIIKILCENDEAESREPKIYGGP